jgi:hypothetical protein
LIQGPVRKRHRCNLFGQTFWANVWCTHVQNSVTLGKSPHSLFTWWKLLDERNQWIHH